MNATKSWLLITLAVGLFAFIMLVERRSDEFIRSAGQTTKLFPSYNPASAIAVEVILKTNQIIRAERINDDWMLALPFKYPAHTTRIENLLRVFGQLDQQAFISASEMQLQEQSLADFGLDPPRADMVVQHQNSRLELKVGGNTPISDQVYVQLVGRDGIFFTPADFLGRLPRSADDWRDPTFLRIGSIHFNRLEVRTAGGGFEVQTDPSTQLWRLTKPMVARADNRKLASIIQLLQNWQIAKFLPYDHQVDLGQYGLRSPDVTLVFGQGTNDALIAQFGRPATDDPGQVYAQCLPQLTLVQVPKEPLDMLRLRFTDLREPHLVSAPLTKVDIIEVRGEEDFSLQRQGNEDWRIILPKIIYADQQLIKQFLADLSSIQIVEYSKDVVTDFSSFGLTTPDRQYTLRTALTNAAAGITNPIVTQLNFGAQQNDKVFARLSDESSVYAARLADYRRLPARFYQLRDRGLWLFNSTNVSAATVTIKGQSRKLLRNQDRQWAQAPNNEPLVAPLAAAWEETLHRLGRLRAEAWTAQGEEYLGQYGITETGHSLVLEISASGRTAVLRVDFGGQAKSENVYAAAAIDGSVMVFEFPWPLYQLYQEVLRGLPLFPLEDKSIP